MTSSRINIKNSTPINGIKPIKIKRKTSIARVNIRPSTKSDGGFSIFVNNTSPTERLNYLISRHLPICARLNIMVHAYVKGGGFAGSDMSVLKALAVGLVKCGFLDKSLCKSNKYTWYDPRKKEAKKYGRFKARAKRQWNMR